MKPTLRSAVSLFTLLALAGTARATALFVNATDATAGGFNAFSNDGVYVAQDFFLTGVSTLTSFTFNAYANGATIPLTDVNLAIYADNAGTVGGELMRGTFALAGAPAFTESLYGFGLYDFTVDLPAWNLAGGNYWLGLKVGPAQPDLHWSVPGDYLGLGLTGSLYPGWTGDGTGDPTSYINGYDWEHVFRLDGITVAGVPDHGATVLLLSLGLVTLTAGRRHRRAE